MLRTLESGKEITIGMEVRFAELWDGDDGNGQELLEDGTVSPDGENVVEFKIVELDTDVLNTIVQVIDIY